MQQFIDKHRDQIAGALSGFDRLVFRGSLRRLNYGYPDPALKAFVATGMEEYLWQNKILFKDYRDHVQKTSERLKEASLKPFRTLGLPIIFERDPKVDKDQLARQQAQERGITSGPVCVISSIEPSPTFEHTRTRITRRIRPCGVLYQYQIHPELGWLYTRIQTWFPFNVQVGLNGREWLSRQMGKQGIQYRQHGNCFVWIEDYQRAQQLLDEQLKTNWAKLLQSFAQQLNPLHEQIFTQYPTDYYWTCFQSEWATDMVFRNAEYLKRLMPILVRQAMLSFSSTDVLRYFGQRVNKSGAVPARFNRKLQSNVREYREGQRVKYVLDGNTLKFYDKAYSECGQVLRIAETTINNVDPFREYRSKEGGPEEDLQWRGLRRGIAGIYRRAEVSRISNERMVDALANVDDSRRVEELTAQIQTPVITDKGRRVRALRPWGEDLAWLTAINRGDFLINGLRNRDLQALLYAKPADSPAEKRRRSAAVSRKLRMLREHGLLHKISKTHRYEVTAAGRTILMTILTTAQTSLHQLNALQEIAV